MRIRWFLIPILALALASTVVAAAQSNANQTRPAASAPVATVATPAPNDKDVVNDQTELIRLLRLSPTLTTVVSQILPCSPTRTMSPATNARPRARQGRLALQLTIRIQGPPVSHSSGSKDEEEA